MAFKSACLLFVLIGSFTSACKPRGSLKLELVQVLFRHGERTPVEEELTLIPYASNELAEPWGFSQLTNNGKRQEYAIGKMLRLVYNDFLGDAYKPNDVLATSSDTDRTKSSLNLVLAGLYVPTDELTWNEDLKWLPVPINYLPKRLDNLFVLTDCAKFDELWQEVMESKEVQEKLTKYDDLFAHLKKFFPDTFKLDLEKLFYLHNIIVIQKSLNVSHSDWYTPRVHEKLREAGKFYLDTLSYNQELIRLNGGALTRRFLENMDSSEETKTKQRKIYLYSGHEYTVYAVSKAHNITLKNSPGYGSAFIVEKLRDEAGKIFVKINYWTGMNGDLTLLKLNGCGKVCPIEKYRKIVGPSLSTDKDFHCLIDNISMDELGNILYAKK